MSEPQNPSGPPSGGWPQQPPPPQGPPQGPPGHYGQPPPQGQPPAQPYPPPDYQPPYPPPDYQQPEYQQPDYQQPDYQQPEYQQPEYQQQPPYPPSYQQPAYQEPAYQQPYQQWQQQYAYPGGTQRLGVVGLILAFIGEALLMISLLGLDWVGRPDGISASFSDLTDSAKAPGAPGLSHAYFVWLGWIFVIATVLVAILANLPIGRTAGFFRILGPLVAIGGIVLTIFALKFGGSLGDVFDNVEIGFWVACAGFLVSGIGAAIGPRSA